MEQATRNVLMLSIGTLLLAACQFGQPSISTSNIPPRNASLLDDQVVVVAPQGYCIDQDSVQERRQSGFVLMAGCDGLMGLPSGTLIEPAVLTVAAYVPDRLSDDPLDVEAALKGATVLERHQVEGMTLLHLAAPDIVPQHSAAEHWRGAMMVNGAILTLAVYGNDAIAGEAGGRLLQDLARKIRVASPATERVTQANQPKKTKNLFQRMFN